jgi:hypothetical protein
MSIGPAFQSWLVRTFASATPVASLMRTHWAWPAAESVHFVGLSLLVGTLVVWDLRLLGVARRIPFAALHKLVRWTLVGYGMSAASGLMFLMTEPAEYVYNPAFQFKLLFMALAGLNALTFYATVSRPTMLLGADRDAPLPAQVIAALSLALWLGVIVSGRLLTFYRPGTCGADPPAFLAECNPLGPR